MYQLHIANKNYSSWSLRPWVLMRELRIPFEERLTPFASGSNWDAFRRFAPNGRVPCLWDGETVVWDSLGITEYLAERHEGVWPVNPRARAWARCAVAEMHAGFGALRESCSMSCGIRVRLRHISPALAQDIARLDELWCEGLERFGGPFLASGAFTAVDAFFAPVAFRVQTYDLNLTQAAASYASRLLALDSMREWYGDALRETWRETSHEDDLKRAGEWLADLRVPPA